MVRVTRELFDFSLLVAVSMMRKISLILLENNFFDRQFLVDMWFNIFVPKHSFYVKDYFI